VPFFAYAVGAFTSTPIDMADPGHDEVVFCIITGTLSGGALLTITIQESNASGSGFTDIPGATFSASASQNLKSKWMGVDWSHPSRKRYCRMQGVVLVAGTAEWGAASLRVRNRKQVTKEVAIPYDIPTLTEGGSETNASIDN
jgi:hypothetical protein